MASDAVLPDPSDLESVSPSVGRLITALGARVVHLLLTRLQKPG